MSRWTESINLALAEQNMLDLSSKSSSSFKEFPRIHELLAFGFYMTLDSAVQCSIVAMLNTGLWLEGWIRDLDTDLWLVEIYHVTCILAWPLVGQKQCSILNHLQSFVTHQIGSDSFCLCHSQIKCHCHDIRQNWSLTLDVTEILEARTQFFKIRYKEAEMAWKRYTSF